MKDNTVDEPPGGGKLLEQQTLDIRVNKKPQKSVKLDTTGEILSFSTVTKMVKKLKPNGPVHCIRPHVVSSAAKWFISSFPGNVMYSVKSNPDPVVLKHLYN